MTEPKKKHTLDDFRKPQQDDPADAWTEEEILETAKRIMKKLGIEGDLCDPFEGVRDGQNS